jgi:hypothetical protein
MKLNKALVVVVAIAAAGMLSSSRPAAYSLATSKWSSTQVPIYINPQNADMSAAAAEAAVLWSINEWNTHSGTTFQWQYNGQTNQTSTGNDGKNIVVFRNSTDGGGALASTYTWWSGSYSRVDSDIVIWDGSYQFFTGTSGCSGAGAYVEDIATHELGHALGLNHSGVADATMFSGYSYCSQDQRTLAADDIAGAQALYPRSTTGTSNTAPTVQISSPAPSSSFTAGTSFTLAGSASDSQDGSLTANIAWTSSIHGLLGYGGSLVTAFSAGTHVVTAQVTDSGGLVATKQITVYVSEPATTNTAPAVQISSPAASSSFTTGTSFTLAGSANDTQDGNLTARIAWTSSIHGLLGYGGSLVTAFSAGTHVVTAQVTDSGGLTSTRQITVYVTDPVTAAAPVVPATDGATLSASAYKVKGTRRVDLRWSGLSDATVTVYRNSTPIGATTNDGFMTDPLGGKGGGSYTYKVCGATACTNAAVAAF